MFTPTSRAIPYSDEDELPEAEPLARCMGSFTGCTCLTSGLFGVGIVADVANFGRFSVGTSSDLSILPWELLKCLLHTLLLGLIGRFFSPDNMYPVPEQRLVREGEAMERELFVMIRATTTSWNHTSVNHCVAFNVVSL